MLKIVKARLSVTVSDKEYHRLGIDLEVPGKHLSTVVLEEYDLVNVFSAHFLCTRSLYGSEGWKDVRAFRHLDESHHTRCA